MAGMNEYFILAFVVMPILVVLLGYLSLRLLDWDLRRYRQKHPAE